jgi:non-heme chloroperoxidase
MANTTPGSGYPVVFIHGLWIHASAWQPWIDLFAEHGYQGINPSWPGDGATVEESRKHPENIAGHGVKEVADSFAKVIATLDSPPILIGHSFGGLIAQVLLGRGIAAAAIAIDPAPIKGVWQLPVSALRSSLPVLRNPLNRKRAVSLTFDEFRYAFVNAIPESEGKDLYDRHTIPAPGLPLFQAATATFNPKSETTVNVKNSTRGPLLITAGDQDHIAPPVLAKAAQKYHKKHSSATTDLTIFPGAGHSLVIDHTWIDVAHASLAWLKKQGL